MAPERNGNSLLQSGGVWRGGSGCGTRSGRNAASRAGGAAVEEATGEDIRTESDKERKSDERDANKACLKEERDRLILDDFFGGGDDIGMGGVHSDACTTEANPEKNRSGRETSTELAVWLATIGANANSGVARSIEPGLKGDTIKAKANISRLGDVAIESW